MRTRFARSTTALLVLMFILLELAMPARAACCAADVQLLH